MLDPAAAAGGGDADGPAQLGSVLGTKGVDQPEGRRRTYRRGVTAAAPAAKVPRRSPGGCPGAAAAAAAAAGAAAAAAREADVNAVAAERSYQVLCAAELSSVPGTFFKLNAGGVHPHMRASEAEWLTEQGKDVFLVSL
jgi:hypothetical protein